MIVKLHRSILQGGIVGIQDIIRELPMEVSTEVAARILGVSKDTVLRLKRSGLLEYRNAAPPESSRPVYRFTMASVQSLRTTYTRDDGDVPGQNRNHRRSAQRSRKPAKYIRITDD